jgi:hypothetical protein
MDSWKPTRYKTSFLGYENERCFHGDRSLETNTSLWDQQVFPWILIRYIRACSDQTEVRVSCGGRVQYLHRSPASRTRQRKGNPVPGVQLDYPIPEGYK